MFFKYFENSVFILIREQPTRPEILNLNKRGSPFKKSRPAKAHSQDENDSDNLNTQEISPHVSQPSTPRVVESQPSDPSISAKKEGFSRGTKAGTAPRAGPIRLHRNSEILALPPSGIKFLKYNF